MDGGGHSLRNSILLPPASPPASSWHWPWAATVQMDWAIWQCLLPQLAAITLLGPWLKSPHLHAFIPFNPTTMIAFIVWPGSFWQTYCPLNPHATWQLLTLFPSAIVLELPVNYSFVCIHHWSRANLILVGHQPLQAIPLTLDFDMALHWTHLLVNSNLLEAVIRNSSTIGLLDGSYMPQQYPRLATAAWMLADSVASTPSLFSGVCPVSGLSASVNAYWAELQGIYALLAALKHFCIQHHITSGGLLIGCNNHGALGQAQHFHEHVPCALAHVDLIQAITTLRA